MADSQTFSRCALHRPFRLYDPEAVAILTILLGLFQLLMGVAVYFMDIDIRLLYVCPVFVGVVHVAVGSLAMACERSPSRLQLKACFYTSIFGLLAGLSAIVVYSYASRNTLMKPCDVENMRFCPEEALFHMAHAVLELLLVYDMFALILQGFVSFSAMKGLKPS